MGEDIQLEFYYGYECATKIVIGLFDYFNKL